MGKRSRETVEDSATLSRARKARRSDEAPSVQKGTTPLRRAAPPAETSAPVAVDEDGTVSIQIITGSYERVLHGFVATFPKASLASTTSTSTEQHANTVTFTDTFLFNAHGSSIRSIAVSPPNESTSDRRILATGAADERINLYQVSATAPKADPVNGSSSLLPRVASNSRNRELGSLLHHSRTVTCLTFPTRGKLFSAADDNTIAITRVRDWTMLSSIKAPLPKPVGRPSGDTAAPGEIPAGVNDFAFHPSMKLMISVGKGERCMRLWNLVTGKKAGVLNFDRDVLARIGEGKYSSGEGRRVLWSADGEKFVVVFERGAVIYDMESRPVAILSPKPLSKIRQARFVPSKATILALSTEDGRVLFYDISRSMDSEGVLAVSGKGKMDERLPSIPCVGQILAGAASPSGRIKDFELLFAPGLEHLNSGSGLICVTASSDGAVQVWLVGTQELQELPPNDAPEKKTTQPLDVWTLLGTKESGTRITCLTAFVMEAGGINGPDRDLPLPVNEHSSESDNSDT